MIRIAKKGMVFFTGTFPIWPLGLVLLLAGCLLSSVIALGYLPVDKRQELMVMMSVEQGSSAVLMERVSGEEDYKKQAANVIAFKPSEGMVEKSFRINVSSDAELRFVPTRKAGEVVIKSVKIVGPLGTLLQFVPLSDLEVISGIESFEIREGYLRLKAAALDAGTNKAHPVLGIKRESSHISFESKFRQWIYFLLLFPGIPVCLVCVYALLATYRAKVIAKGELLTKGPHPHWSLTQILVLVILSLVYTLHVLGFSRYGGRLAFGITYDDVVYFLDGASRLQESYGNSGVLGYLSSYWIEPPHAPASSFLAAIAFALFGFSDWAPYASNFFILLAFVFFGWRLMAGASLPIRVCGMAYLFSSPMLFASVHEFRPDILCGFLTAAGVICVFRSACSEQIPLKPVVLAGFLFGLAVVSKPSLSPFTCLLFSLTWMLAIASYWLRREKGSEGKSVLNAVFVSAGAFLPLALSWYLIGFEEIFNYIYQNQFGDRSEVWLNPMRGSERWLHYLTGSGAVFLGQHLFVALILWTVLCAMAVIGGNKENLRVLILGIFVVLFAYVFACLNPHKSGFFVAGHEALLLYLPLTGLGLARWKGNSGLVHKSAVLAVACMMAGSIIFYSPTKAVGHLWPMRNEPGYLLIKNLPKDVMGTLEQDLVNTGISINGAAQQSLFQTFTGVTNSNTLNWEAMKNGLPIKCSDEPFQDNAQIVIERLNRYDYVLVSNGKSMFVDTHFPSTKIEPEILDFLQDSKSWILLKKFTTENGSDFALYKRHKT